jgi:hypothetical protein
MKIPNPLLPRTQNRIFGGSTAGVPTEVERPSNPELCSGFSIYTIIYKAK